MPTRLKRYYGHDHLHSLTCSCYHREPWLSQPRRRDLFLDILEQVRQRYQFVIVGYVVMPEHIHLLISEPERGTPSTVMQVVKQRFARRVLRRKRRSPAQRELWPDEPHVWQHRFYDFNVWSERKRIEKLRYMHRNPVKRGLVLEPEQWEWSSYRRLRRSGSRKGKNQSVAESDDESAPRSVGERLKRSAPGIAPSFANDAKDGPPGFWGSVKGGPPGVIAYLSCWPVIHQKGGYPAR